MTKKKPAMKRKSTARRARRRPWRRPKTPCCRPGRRRSPCRRSTKSASSISCRPSTAALPRTAKPSPPSPRARPLRPSPTPSTPFSMATRGRLERVSAVFFNLAATDTNADIQAIERALAPRFARHSMRIYQDETLFARVDALFKKRKQAEVERGAAARARALSPRLRQGRRRARAQGQEAHGGDRPAHVRARHPLQPELARRRAGLRDGAGGRIRPRRPAGGRACRRSADGQRARPPGQACHHAGALLGRAVPAIFGEPRFARDGLQGLDPTRRQRRRDRQPQDRGGGPEAQGRAGAAAGLQDGGRLGARSSPWPRRPQPCASC